MLYGPPGTGKTYNTINKALEIIFSQSNKCSSNNENIDQEYEVVYKNENCTSVTKHISYKTALVNDDRVALKHIFEEYKKAGQIEFVTFHQSYGYEEFVEGIKAIPVGKEGNETGDEMVYDVAGGIFKKLSKIALEHFVIDNGLLFKNKTKYLLNAKSLNIQAEMIKDDENSYRVLKGSKIRKGEADSFHKYNYISLKDKVLKTAKYIEQDEFYILDEDYTFQSMSAASSVILGRQSNGFNDWKEGADSENLFSKNENNKNSKNYILIIDEINRGNISKIFGELITLIEPSKRIGADEEIRVKLPYSGDEFGVPQNLYIIGTMNTADRSIAQIDTALRRRFEFIEMLPKPELLQDINIMGIEIQKILQAINERIEYIYDREHQIGHSYFMPLMQTPANEQKEKLDEIFRVNIIPLLAEYFYGDWADIKFVLNDTNDNFITVKDDTQLEFAISESRRRKNKIYNVNKDPFSAEAYQYIYAQKS